ncbi:MAG: amidohydrolase family protein, partial [Rhabdochlamydiaceae bacterium]
PSSSTKYRRVRGGLDNAVKQAEDRGLQDMMIVDADAHYQPFLDLLVKYLAKFYGVKYEFPPDAEVDPRLLGGVADKYQMMKAFSQTPNGVDAMHDQLFAAPLLWKENGPLCRPETKNSSNWGVEEAIDRYTRRMYDIGIKRSVIFPNSYMNLNLVLDPKLEVAMCNAWVDFMLEHFLGKYPEILTIVPLPARSPDKAAELVDRVGSQKGIVGAYFSPISDKLFGDESYDPIYEEMDKKELPALIHGRAHFGIPPSSQFRKRLPQNFFAFPSWIIEQVVSIIVDGTVERFPRIKWVWAESGITWVPWVAHRLDSYYQMLEQDAPWIRKMPSEYLKDFYFTSQPLEEQFNASRELEWIFKYIDAENKMLYASDYPHWDFDVPASIYDLHFLSKQQKEKIMGANAMKLFKIK